MKENLFCGVAFNYHDSSVSFAKDNEIVLVLEAERVFRKKKMRCSATEMEDLIGIGLKEIGREVEDVSYFALATLRNPWLSEEDKTPIPPFWKDVAFLGRKRRSLIVNHHLSHAASFLFSPFQAAKIMTCDGGGDCGERVAIYTGEGNKITKDQIDTLGFMTAKPYDLCSTFLYNAPQCEGKLMALAAYGSPTEEYLSKLEKLTKSEGLLHELCATDPEMGDRLFEKAFPGLKGTASEKDINACNLAASLQDLFVRKRMDDLRKVLSKGNIQNLVLGGGSCLNLQVNTEVWREFPQIATSIPPCCDDTGQSVGALAYLITEVLGKRPIVDLPYLGIGSKEFSFTEKDLDDLVDSLLDDYIVLVHNGKAEIGPRALGNRSFIARPDSARVRDLLSLNVKQREPYRPLAPVVLEERASEYFVGPEKSPFMLHQYGFVSDDVMDSLIGCKHHNKTARVQTMKRNTNPFLYALIQKFGERTGSYVLLNTSLNLRGEPLSNTIEQTITISSRIEQKHRIVYNGAIIK